MTRRTALIVAITLAAVHLLLAGFYASATPYRTSGYLMGQRNPETGGPQSVPDVGAPDERQHVNYTLSLLQGRGFPVLDPKDPNLIENYQAHQPPLFYLMHAGWCRLAGADPLTPDDGVRVRLLNALIGALTVLGAFYLGVWGFGRFDLGVVAASFVALLPMNTALSGAVSNDPLLYCLCAWTIALAARGVKEGWNLKLAIGIGALTGLAILTKTTAVALLPALLCAALISSPRPKAIWIAACIAAVAVVSAPWLIRNQSLYGDPLAISAFNEAFKNSPSRELITQVATVQNVGKDPNFAYWTDWVGWWTARSFFGAFGYMDIFLNELGVPMTSPRNPNALYRMLLALGIVVLGLWAFALKRQEWSEHRRNHILLGTFFAVVVILFIRFNMQYFQGQARYLFPAITVIGVGVGVATLNLARGRWWAALAVVVAILGGLNLYALSRLPEEFKKRTSIPVAQIQTERPQTNVLSGNAGETPRV
jgi:4-amino-4-deoxy-L-arabinose transferase-like glycosyltransferase